MWRSSNPGLTLLTRKTLKKIGYNFSDIWTKQTFDVNNDLAYYAEGLKARQSIDV